MTEIILARHGQTDWNLAEVFRGRTDIPLNSTGIKQAELLSEYLSGVKIDAVYSSPLKRALATAEAINRTHKLKIETSLGLLDLNYGKWEGISNKEVMDKYKELYEKWTNHPEEVTMPEGESLDDVKNRAMAVIEDIIERCVGVVVLVSHRVVNKVLICALLGLDNSHFWKIKQDTCGITRFTYNNGRFILTRHNDTSYLEPTDQTLLSDF